MLPDAFERTGRLCAQLAVQEQAEVKQLLTNVQQALQTWQEVWPRLGTSGEFRAAVAREARQWSKRFSEG